MLWLGNGRIAGISGIFGQLLPPAPTVLWRLVFLVALVARHVARGLADPRPRGRRSGRQAGRAGGAAGLVQCGTPVWIAVVGPVDRASAPRSAMAARRATASAVSRGCRSDRSSRWRSSSASPSSLSPSRGSSDEQAPIFAYLAVAAAAGLLFGAGLYVSQMVDPLKVLRFLDFTAIPTGGWDPSLAFVIVSGHRGDVHCRADRRGGSERRCST